MVRLDILSDPICPWCYIGKANLDRALVGRADVPFVIEWHPFQLNPEMPRTGVDRDSYLAARMGGAEGMARADAMLAERAEAAGVTINRFVGQRIPNTLDAHRLIHWAGIEGRQSAAVDALFAANFVEGRDIGDRAELAGIAGRIGLDAAAVARLLDSDADIDLIRERESHSRARGVSAVPTFIIADHYVVQGAQPPELWLQVIDEIAAEAAGDGA
ncbi:MAG: DsbA family oxidoreductase [Rubellimicrobium sp.]|nr:DsbA family oxidoreductase [Rubellimicrobium sp.]